MQINTFKVFTWDRILIYLGICFLFPLVAFGFGVHYNYFEHHNGIPLPGWIAFISAMLGFSLGDFMLFWDRWQFKKSIWGYTEDGIAIIKPTYKIDNLPSFDSVSAAIAAATKYDVDFWEKIYPNYGNQMEDAMNGAFIGFTGQKIELLASPPLSSVVTPNKFQSFAVGITEGNDCLIMWQEGEDFVTNVIPRIKHELGHVCLNAANVEQDSDYQHKIMAEYGFPF